MADTTYVALLRGINLGSRRRIAMSRLRELCEELGYPGAITHLQSGNVVITGKTKKPETVARAIEKKIASDLDMQVDVIVRTRDELAAVVERNPMPGRTGEPAKLHVTFLSKTPDPARVAEIDAAAYEPDAFQVVDREIYLWYANGVQGTRLGNDFWEKRLGVSGTARNWNTVTKLLSLADR
jgi:uncharacterized protein (DUF1697 family)